MDADRFDGLTRALSDGMTRRGITRLLGGLALSGFLPSLTSAAKRGDQHEKGHPDKGDHGKKDGTGHRKQDSAPDKPGKAERTAGKHGPKPGQADTRKTSKPDTDETPTASTAREATTEPQATDGTVMASATSETCLPAGDACTRDRQCCSRRCSRKGKCRCSAASPCPAGQTCQHGKCVCPNGTKLCNGGCIPGDACCGNADCPYNQVCQSGRCGCPEGTEDCYGDGFCESLDTIHNCGGCFNGCYGELLVCRGGRCLFDAPCGPDRPCSDYGLHDGWVCENGQCVQSGCCIPWA